MYILHVEFMNLKSKKTHRDLFVKKEEVIINHNK